MFPHVEFLWADVICNYWPWALQKNRQVSKFDLAMQSKPCLSVMHANAHSWHCQVRRWISNVCATVFYPMVYIQILWGGRMQNGSAGSTGEEMEQLFSYMSRLNLTTKNVTAAGM